MEVAQMLKSFKTWHCFQKSNEEINKTALKHTSCAQDRKCYAHHLK